MSELNLGNPRGAVDSAAEAAGRTLWLCAGPRDDTEGENARGDSSRETRQTTDYPDVHTRLIRQPTAVLLPYQPASPAGERRPPSKRCTATGIRRGRSTRRTPPLRLAPGHQRYER